MFLVIAIPFITVTGATIFPYTLRLPLIYTVGILFAVVFVLTDITLQFNAVSGTAFILLSYICISIAYSYDPASTLNLFWLYLCAFTLLFIDLPGSYYKKIFTIIYVICSVIAFSILISAVIDNCMLKYFWFIVNPNNSAQVAQTIQNELSIGAYSGFAREKGEAAYIMNVGIALLLSKYFSSQQLKKIDILMLFVFIVSLMLTGKRTLFIIPVLSFALFMVISNIKGKFAKTGGIVLSALSAVFILSMFIPKVANIFDRFMDEENIMALGNRDSLWKYFLLMGEKYPVFGAGFGSYNQFAYDNGLRVGGARWNFNGHNCYFQIAVELGIVGSIFFLLFAVLSVVLTILAIRRVKNICDDARICYFSLYIQIMILAYSVTGNPTYSRQIMFIWFFSIGAVLHIARKHNIDIVINKESERRHL